MCAKINSKYLENYSKEFTGRVCDGYYGSRKYMTGQEILQLTPSPQVNYFIIKALFEAWQLELEKLKSNPYFDYRDNNVHDALKEFMNVLSRSIKIERSHFEPLLEKSVALSIILAIDPVSYYSEEFTKAEPRQLNDFLKENKKYYKWHFSLIANLIDRAGISHTHEAYTAALESNYEAQKNSLDTSESLLKTLDPVYPLDMTRLLEKNNGSEPMNEGNPVAQNTGDHTAAAEEPKELEKEVDKEETMEFMAAKTQSTTSIKRTLSEHLAIDPLQAWARFESEEYSIMKGSIGELSESIGINQRFMFTKELFDGNPDLMQNALKSIDKCDSFVDAIQLVNERYVGELNWHKESEAVEEFLQLVFRKFDQRG